jgi:hypothetical protein
LEPARLPGVSKKVSPGGFSRREVLGRFSEPRRGWRPGIEDEQVLAGCTLALTQEAPQRPCGRKGLIKVLGLCQNELCPFAGEWDSQSGFMSLLLGVVWGDSEPSALSLNGEETK